MIPSSMRVTWLVNLEQGFLPERLGADYCATCNVASYRYRVGLPAQALQRGGLDCSVVVVSGHSECEMPKTDVLVVPKLSTKLAEDFRVRAPRWLAIIDRLKADGARVVVDVCDNHFSDYRGPVLRALVARADAVTCSTGEMQLVLGREAGVNATIIGDPVSGGARGEVRFAPGEPLRLLWYGNARNLPAFIPQWPGLVKLAGEHPLHLSLLSSAYPEVEEFLAQLRREPANGIEIAFTEWSLAAMDAAFVACDLVILPGLPEDPWYRVKSANRLTDALWAGRPVLASPVPAYREFADCAGLGEDLAAGIRSALADPQLVAERTRMGQLRVAETLSSQAIARCWLDVFRAATA
jgi:hypothetical protein